MIHNNQYLCKKDTQTRIIQQQNVSVLKCLDCLQSAFSLKIHLVLIAALPLASLGFACSNFAKKNKRLLAVYKMLHFKLTHLSHLMLEARQGALDTFQIIKVKFRK